MITHLKGRVRVEMLEFSHSSHHMVVIYADEANYNERTGELTPTGNVRITQEEMK